MSLGMQPRGSLAGHCSALNTWEKIGIMENQMETTIVYWGFIWIMEKKMEATIV